jgi:hypothetical protein
MKIHVAFAVAAVVASTNSDAGLPDVDFDGALQKMCQEHDLPASCITDHSLLSSSAGPPYYLWIHVPSPGENFTDGVIRLVEWPPAVLMENHYWSKKEIAELPKKYLGEPMPSEVFKAARKLAIAN